MALGRAMTSRVVYLVLLIWHDSARDDAPWPLLPIQTQLTV